MTFDFSASDCANYYHIAMPQPGSIQIYFHPIGEIIGEAFSYDGLVYLFSDVGKNPGDTVIGVRFNSYLELNALGWEAIGDL